MLQLETANLKLKSRWHFANYLKMTKFLLSNVFICFVRMALIIISEILKLSFVFTTLMGTGYYIVLE